jgi:uncharacterized protein (DUF2062 family)
VTDAPSGASPSLKERLRRAWIRLRGGSLSPGRAAASVGVGLFVACLPFYGAQLFLVLLVCVPLRLDSAFAYLVTHVNNPFTLPLFLWFELELGSRLLTGKDVAMRFAEVKRIGFAAASAQIAVGALTSAVTLATVGAVATWLVAHRLRDARHRDFAEARRRTLARYAATPRSARSYVGIKMRTDPSLAAIVSLDGNFGRVVDAGCGYLQLGLCLLELGRATSLVGYDADAERVAVGRTAAGPDASIEQADIGAVPFPVADTVLFVDSLHYLPLAVQDAALARAAGAIADGGRVVVREVDSGASLRSGLTERLERNAVKKRGTTDGPSFRSAADIAAVLTSHGLTTTIVQHDDLSIVHNALVIGRKPPLPDATDAAKDGARPPLRDGSAQN